jgi:hypothetical protein
LEGQFQMDGLMAPYVRVFVPVELASGVLHVPFSWPTPDWVGARHAAYFNTYWNQRLGSALAAGKGHELEGLLALFLHGLLWAHEAIRKPDEEPGSWQDELKACVLTYKKLEASASRELHEQAFLEWFDERLLLLAEPESGLPSHIVSAIQRAMLGEKQQRPTLKLRAARLKRAERALEEIKPPDLKLSAKRLLRRIDAQLQGAKARQRPAAPRPPRRKPPSAPRPTHAHH